MDLLIKEASLKRAEKLHEQFPAADGHLDLAGEILLRSKAGEKDIIKNYYLNHWKKAGLHLIVSSVFVDSRILKQQGTQGAWENALLQLAALEKDMENIVEEVKPVRSKGELSAVLKENKIGIITYMEGLDCIGTCIDRLEKLFSRGVRGASLTWSRNNSLANGCCKARERIQIPGGLSRAGKEAVQEMERLSMFLDISHLNDDGFEDIAELAGKPFVATHSCAKAVYENYRNLTDTQMETLAGQGGIMGINGCKHILGSQSGNHLEMLCRHIEYAVDKIGASHVGYGFDLCDSYDAAESALAGKTEEKGKQERELHDCFLNHSQLPLLTAALLQRGMDEADVIQIMGGNFLSYFKQVLPE